MINVVHKRIIGTLKKVVRTTIHHPLGYPRCKAIFGHTGQCTVGCQCMRRVRMDKLRCNIFSTIHVCAYLLRPSGLIGTIT